MAYIPIQDYGVIGNMRTAALVSNRGSIDWYCCPKFDSPSVFGRILDDKIGGYFQISPVCEDVTEKQFYWPDTNVLVTRFLSEKGIVELIDFMPTVGEEEARHQIIRHVHCVRGEVPLVMACHPAFDYARAEHATDMTAHGAIFSHNDLRLALSTLSPLSQTGSGVESRFALKEGESATFTFRKLQANEKLGHIMDPKEGERLFYSTVEYWKNWVSKCTYRGRWREMVQRSALALKLLTYEPTGAIVAAVTCSLPEEIGGKRNWDYRFTWIRDAAFTIYALMRIGFNDEAKAFMGFLDKRLKESRPDGEGDGSPLQIVYGIEGESNLEEIDLHHLDGYRSSKPVRIGNGAHTQLQLDIYGELLDSIYLYNKYGAPISYETWTQIQKIIGWLQKNWDQPDEGIWEVRSGRQKFTYSKLMSWVAFDRAIRLAEKRSFPADRVSWLKTRDEIYMSIMTEGWCEKRQAFTQAFENESLDAASLLMPLVFFVSPNDPRMLSTLDAINCSPAKGGLVTDGLVFRYDLETFHDGLAGKEGTFNICSFWLVEALTRAGRTEKPRLQEARILFERLLNYSNHVGLYAEQTSGTGQGLGNYPQAFTHLALISSAFNLDRELGERG